LAWSDTLSGYLHSLPHSLSAGGPALQAASSDAGSVQPLTILMGSCCKWPPPFSTNQHQGQGEVTAGLLVSTHDIKIYLISLIPQSFGDIPKPMKLC